VLHALGGLTDSRLGTEPLLSVSDSRRGGDGLKMSDALIKAISVLVDGDARTHLSGVIVHRTHGEDRKIPFTADGRTGEWAYSIGRMTASRDRYGNVVQRIGRGAEDRGGNADHVPFELRIIFPLTLLIWDRAGDEWRMVSADEDGDQVTVHLVDREHPQLTAELTVDTARRLAVRFSTPGDTISVEVQDGEDSEGSYASYES